MKRTPLKKASRISLPSQYYECVNPRASRMDCKQVDPCEIEKNEKEALSQIEEIKKYMIGASEFDVLEKLIDLNAPKFVIDFQMKRVEEEEQGVINKNKPNPSSFTPLEIEDEGETTDGQCSSDTHGQRNVQLRRGQEMDKNQTLPRKKSGLNVYGRQSPSYHRGPLENKTDEDPCQYLEDKEDEKNMIKDLKQLLDAEYADAKSISAYLPRKLFMNDKPCKGTSIPETLSFTEGVERGIEAAVGKLSEKDEDLHPEVAAAMLHSEEKGIGLSLTPREIYETLFPGGKDKCMIEVTSASSAKPRDVLPLSLPTITSKDTAPKEDAALLDFIQLEGDKKFSLPEANLQEDEVVDNEDDVLGIVDSQVLSEEAATFKVMLSPDGLYTSSQIQMRGSQPPSWFPVPNDSEIISEEKPWTILEKAWQNFRPSKVKPKKGAIIVGV